MKNYILDIHEIGAQRLNNPISLPEMRRQLVAKGYKANEQPLMNSVTRVFGEVFVVEYNEQRGYSITEDAKYTMTSEAYYRYLEYLEMKQAHTSSKQAARMAIAAIVISIILGLGQIMTQ